ncbi:MAG: murein biosynthesis integral membrane protein MurJ [Herpetosiphonaceae bacterium]|nr:murein biosynthesis integral membrane protein MurJ [Herpetosiphonaceae bacterium]
MVNQLFARLAAYQSERIASGSINRRIFHTALTIASLTFGVKLVSLIKDVSVAAAFGTGDSVEAFLMAYVLPTFVIGIVGGSLNAALIPTYIQLREVEGQPAADRLFSSTVIIAGTILLLTTTILASVGHMLLPLLATGFSPAKRALTERLFYLLLPAILLNGIATTWGAVLNAGEQFALVAIAPGLVPLVMITSLRLSSHSSIAALPLGLLGGTFLQLCVLAWGLRRSAIPLHPHWHGHDRYLRQVLHQFAPLLLAGLLMNSTLLVDQFIASLLHPGSVAALGYGNKLVSLMTSISTTALGTALLPYLSKLVARAEWQAVSHTIKTYTVLVLALMLPITTILYTLSAPIAHLVFQRGAFTPTDTLLVARVQAMYILQLPAFTLCIVFVRLLSSLQMNYILTWGTIINCVVNITLDYLLVRHFGVAGIALATSFVYLVSLCFLATMALRQLWKH